MAPKVICHIMGSVDGRLLPDRWTLPPDGTPQSALFSEYAALGKSLGADAWMFGKATACEAFPDKFIPGSADRVPAGKVHAWRRDSERLFITVDPDADILYSDSRLRGDNILTVLGTNATADYLAMLEDKGISYIVLADPTDLREALEKIHEHFGIHTVVLQGGGIINGAMLAAGLIDELSLVVYPGIDGLASSPSVFEYLGAPDESPAARQSLQLLAAEVRCYGIVWLRYRFHHNA
ncbi:MAG: dihydrofolate reductase family protein [Muribaculaceae bacterium]|nr:dihydrofolate reductase family protein [Muribaculaceae bacterium]